MHQVAEIRFGLDFGEISDQDFGQKKGPREEGLAPIPMEKAESNMRDGVSNALSNKRQSFIDAENYTEVTSPHKPMGWAQTLEDTAAQTTVHEIGKNKIGRCRIKKIAREWGLAQSKNKEAQDQSIGLKRQMALLFSEGTENPAKKKKCEGSSRGINEGEISVVATMQHRRRP